MVMVMPVTKNKTLPKNKKTFVDKPYVIDISKRRYNNINILVTPSVFSI